MNLEKKVVIIGRVLRSCEIQRIEVKYKGNKPYYIVYFEKDKPIEREIKPYVNRECWEE